MFLGIATIFLLPDRPELTTFLTERERELAIERMNRSTSGDHGAVVQKGNDLKLQFRTLINLSFLQFMFMRLSAIGGCVHRIYPESYILTQLFEQIYAGGVIYFALNNALSAISAFLPTIITTFGFSTFPS